MNDFLLPALRMTVNTMAYPVPANYHKASEHGGVGQSGMKLDQANLQTFFNNLKNLTNNEACIFKNFFLVVYSHGLKMPISHEIQETESVIGSGLRTTPLDLAAVDRKRLTLDLAITFLPPTPTVAATGLWSNYNFVALQNFKRNMIGSLKGKFRLDNFSNFRGLGGFKYTESNNSIFSMQAYSPWKHNFFKRNSKSNRQGKDFSPLDVYNHSSEYKNLLVSLLNFKIRFYCAN